MAKKLQKETKEIKSTKKTREKTMKNSLQNGVFLPPFVPAAAVQEERRKHAS
jgi:hypothetical protein